RVLFRSPPAITFGGSDYGVTCGERVAGLDADRSGILPEQLVEIVHSGAVPTWLVAASAHDEGEVRFLEKQIAEHRDVVGGCVVVGRVKSVRVHKVRVLEAGLCHSGVHQVGECLHVPGHLLCDLERGIIAGRQKQAVKQVDIARVLPGWKPITVPSVAACRAVPLLGTWTGVASSTRSSGTTA